MPEPSSSPGRAALSRELSEFLIELSIALHRHAMYPEGHPSLEPAAQGVIRRADLLFVGRPTISLGVARNQLVIEGVATDPKHPVLRELAGRLHRHHLGAVTFSRGVEATELTSVLQTLALEAERTGQPLGLGPPEQLRAWPHVALHPLTYERLELVDDGNGGGTQSAGGEAATRSAQLWVGLARAALATGPADEAPTTEPAAVAKSIDEHPRVAGYDQVIVGYLLQIADELKSAGGQEAVALRRRTSKLIKNLRPDTLRALVDMGGDFAQRQKFALAATSGMAVDAVLEVVQAAAAASGQHISHSFLRLLSKLAVHAEGGATGARAQADTALRDQVSRLISGWNLADPNPEVYGAALQQMASARPVVRVSSGARYEAEPLRVLQIGIETDHAGPVVWRALDDLLASGEDAGVLDLLERAPDGVAAAAAWARVATPERLALRLATEPVDFAVADRLVARLDPAAAAGPLLDALATAESRTTRRALLDRVARLGAPVVPIVIARLGDARWYVVRNLLGVLQELPLPVGFSAAPFAAHADARVRREALRLQFRLPAERDQALVAALSDDDPRALQFALHAARQGCPAAAVPVVIALAQDRALDSDLRVLAIRVLGGTRAPPALAPLLDLVDGGTTFFGRRKLRPKSPEMLTALAALASSWATESRAAALVGRAAKSPDPEIHAAAGPRGRKK